MPNGYYGLFCAYTRKTERSMSFLKGPARRRQKKSRDAVPWRGEIRGAPAWSRLYPRGAADIPRMRDFSRREGLVSLLSFPASGRPPHLEGEAAEPVLRPQARRSTKAAPRGCHGARPAIRNRRGT
jgi:hypothetical protein